MSKYPVKYLSEIPYKQLKPDISNHVNSVNLLQVYNHPTSEFMSLALKTEKPCDMANASVVISNLHETTFGQN